MTQSDGAAFHRQRLADHPNGFGEDVLRRLRTGAAISSTEYALARQRQTLLRRQFCAFLEGYDLLLTPATPIPAPRRGAADAVERARLLTRFTAPFNLTGLPALSIPCGFTNEGLPVGLQLVASPWGEAGLLRDETARSAVPIVFRLEREQRSGLEGLLSMTVPSMTGRLVPIRELVTVRKDLRETFVYHKNLQPVTYVTGDMAGGAESPVYAILTMNRAIDAITLPEGYALDVFNRSNAGII